MDNEKITLTEQEEALEKEIIEDDSVEEAVPFEPSPRWKRILAWIMFFIVILGVINWLISIAYPEWPRYVMELFR